MYRQRQQVKECHVNIKKTKNDFSDRYKIEKKEASRFFFKICFCEVYVRDGVKMHKTAQYKNPLINRSVKRSNLKCCNTEGDYVLLVCFIKSKKRSLKSLVEIPIYICVARRNFSKKVRV